MTDIHTNTNLKTNQYIFLCRFSICYDFELNLKLCERNTEKMKKYDNIEIWNVLLLISEKYVIIQTYIFNWKVLFNRFYFIKMLWVIYFFAYFFSCVPIIHSIVYYFFSTLCWFLFECHGHSDSLSYYYYY